ncbi:MAG TPA: response regulator transcription factor [Blastocatellia bacterium]|nr:response regulator transcription factor [Blastocatellia bacterium]
MIRVLLVEDHTLVRAGLRSLLQSFGGIQVVAEAGDGRDALRLVEAHKPDLVLMDVAMPGLNGLEATTRLRKEYPGIRVLILSMYSNEEYVIQSLRAGAAGYLLKDAATTELDLAIKAIARGETYLSPAVSKVVVSDYVRRVGGEGSEVPSDRSPYERLTPRQREILQLIAEGHTTKEIAHLLNISAKTVETHRMQLMSQLDIHDVAGLVRYAIRKGLVTSDD